MNFRQLAKRLDESAVLLTTEGHLEKAFHVMELAAFIRRQSKEFQRCSAQELLGED